MMKLLRALFFVGPLLFAFGFLMPLFAQIIEQTGWVPPAGLSPLLAGAIIAGALGLVAQVRGRWI